MNSLRPKYNVLVVDDEQKICNLIKVFLSMSPHFGTIVTANNSVQALQKLQNQKFDLIIADYMMAGKKGTELLEQVLKISSPTKMRFLLISGCLTKEVAQKAIQIGIKNIIVKPFSRKQLMDKISQVLEIGL